MEQHIREMLRSGTWSTGAGEELQIGRHTVRLKRSLAEGGFAFIHLVEVGLEGHVIESLWTIDLCGHSSFSLPSLAFGIGLLKNYRDYSINSVEVWDENALNSKLLL